MAHKANDNMSYARARLLRRMSGDPAVSLDDDTDLRTTKTTTCPPTIEETQTLTYTRTGRSI